MSIQVGDMKLYEVEELAEILGVGLPTIRKYLREGRLKGTSRLSGGMSQKKALKEYFRPEPEVQEEGAG